LIPLLLASLKNLLQLFEWKKQIFSLNPYDIFLSITHFITHHMHFHMQPFHNSSETIFRKLTHLKNTQRASQRQGGTARNMDSLFLGTSLIY